MKRDDLNDLMTFSVISDERSFTRAAVKPGISSSAPSKRRPSAALTR